MMDINAHTSHTEDENALEALVQLELDRIMTAMTHEDGAISIGPKRKPNDKDLDGVGDGKKDPPDNGAVDDRKRDENHEL